MAALPYTIFLAQSETAREVMQPFLNLSEFLTTSNGEFMKNECEALPGVAYPRVRDNRSTLNTKNRIWWWWWWNAMKISQIVQWLIVCGQTSTQTNRHYSKQPTSLCYSYAGDNQKTKHEAHCKHC